MQELLPKQAWDLLLERTQDAAEGAGDPPLFVDVRMEIEFLYVGHPPGAQNIPWYEYPAMTPDPAAFVAAVERAAGSRHRAVVLICRSGKRARDAGQALAAAGFGEVVAVVHGFEGDLNEALQRSRSNGWRFDGLPWEQM
ncbi:rhodanese-like domain-containing protein [Pseudorhodoferax soli]|uniref:Thiosulfate sulfurtransferase n=1 Tax=Pseudorhodoferax soli TaxID=545864 RepID=A0A368XG83_9BURK|nr:rhodanese-like domain-containing protein [Pseudorhodoferax soli]RCW66845.1 thiosulfate sulfurtransferase [Pseudorhodoferax soli]